MNYLKASVNNYTISYVVLQLFAAEKTWDNNIGWQYIQTNAEKKRMCFLK